jgi:hypothetical protein
MKFEKRAGMGLRLALALALFVCCQFLLLANGAAYLDPSTMTYVIQIAAGAVIAGGAAIAVFWHKIKRFFKRAFKGGAEGRPAAPDAAKNEPPPAPRPAAPGALKRDPAGDAPFGKAPRAAERPAAPVVEPAEKRKCPFCGAELASPAAKFCAECGAALRGKCPSCGVEITAPKAKFCSECGAPLNGRLSSP